MPEGIADQEQAAQQQDLVSLLMSQTTEPAASGNTPPEQPAKEPVTSTVTTPAAEPTATTPTTTTPTEPAEPVKQPDPTQTQPQPGTPDKAMQRMQQDLGAATRKLDELLAKASDGPLDTRQQEQLQQAQRKIDTIRAAVKSDKFDVLTDGGELAESLIETDTTVQQLQKTVQKQSEQIEGLLAGQNDTIWSTLQKRYAGVNLQDTWNNCLEESAKLIGADNPALQKLSNKLFHGRCDAAAKSIAAKNATKTGKETAATTSTPVTPGGAQVQVQNAVVNREPASDETRHMNDYMSLVK